MGKIVTSYGVDKMTGRVGNGVFSIVEGGTDLRQHNAISKQPFSDSQRVREAAFTKANQTWTTIGREAATAWRKWGAEQKVKTVAGKFRGREGKDCFVGLFAKMLQVNPLAAIPVPPAFNFAGDPAVMSISVSSGAVDWDLSQANRPGVTMELMGQRLPSEVALPNKAGYRTIAFHSYPSGALSFQTDLEPGYWCFAAQAVEVASGRVANFQELGFGTVNLAVMQGGLDEAPEAGEKKAA